MENSVIISIIMIFLVIVMYIITDSYVTDIQNKNSKWIGESRKPFKLSKYNLVTQVFSQYKNQLEENGITDLLIYRYNNSLCAEYAHINGNQHLSQYCNIESEAGKIIRLTKQNEKSNLKNMKTGSYLFSRTIGGFKFIKPNLSSGSITDKALSLIGIELKWTWNAFINQDFLTEEPSEIADLLDDIMDEVIDKSPNFLEQIKKWEAE